MGKQSWALAFMKRHFPIIKWLPKYNFMKFQGISYASGIALLPPEYGLYTAFTGGLFYLVMGTAKDVELGPCAVMSLLVGSLLAQPQYTKAQEPLCLAKWNDPTFCTNCISKGWCTPPSAAITVSLMAGLIQFTMGVFRLDLLSHSVISGFTTGAALTIVVEQLKSIFGLKNVRRNFLPAATDTAHTIGDTKKWDLCMGLVSLFVLLVFRQCKKYSDVRKARGQDKTPSDRRLNFALWTLGTLRNFLIVIVTGFIAYGVSLTSDPNCASNATVKQCVLSLTGYMPGGLIPTSVPSLGPLSIGELMPAAVIIAAVSLLETTAIGKSFARKNNYVVEPTQEFLAIGAANIAGSFVSAYPVTASFSRTAINCASGVQTQIGIPITSFIVLISVATLTNQFFYIPSAALGAMIIVAVLDMINFHVIVVIWRTKRWDVVPWLATFFAVLFASVEIGILVGLVVSFLPLIYYNLRPRAELLGIHRTHGTYEPLHHEAIHRHLVTSDRWWDPQAIKMVIKDTWQDILAIYEHTLGERKDEVQELDNIRIIRLGGPLSFLSVNFALEQLQQLTTGEITDLSPRPFYALDVTTRVVPPKAVIVDCQLVEHIDFTAAEALAVIVRRAHASKVLVYLTNVCPAVKSVLLHTELVRHGMFASTIQDAVGVAQLAESSPTIALDDDETLPLVDIRRAASNRPLVLFDSFDGSFVTLEEKKSS